MSATDKLSTTALAKRLGMPGKALFEQLAQQGLIVRIDNSWELTQAGRAAGGESRKSERFGVYIVWPEQLGVDGKDPVVDSKATKLTASQIGAQVSLSARQVNALLSELGWINRYHKGWQLTPQGQALGAQQKESNRTGIPYALWPEHVLKNRAFELSLKALQGDLGQALGLNETADQETVSFRQKFPANFRTADGHQVRSKAEMIIDNWLYMAEIVHAYERKLPVEEDVYCDFYIPSGKVYIEYWGYEEDPKYLKRKREKLDVYARYGLNLIELKEADVQILDDVLPRLLLKFGVETY